MTDDTKPKRGRKPKRIDEYNVDAEQATREVQEEYRRYVEREEDEAFRRAMYDWSER